jgi:Trk-type K+ transport system membrane component
MNCRNFWKHEEVRVFIYILVVIFGLSVILALGLVAVMLFFNKCLDTKIFALICVLATLPGLVLSVFCRFLNCYSNYIDVVEIARKTN